MYTIGLPGTKTVSIKTQSSLPWATVYMQEQSSRNTILYII